MTATPWWDALSLRDEIARTGGNINDVQMSLFAAVHEAGSTVYADVDYYSDITHPTRGLVELMGSIAVRLASPSNSGSVKAVWRGDQGMGGGKSHAQVGLFHMASQPSEFFATDLGQKVMAGVKEISGESVPTDLNSPTVVVLPCDRMDPFKPDKKLDNVAETLGQRWLWRLFGGDLHKFHEYADDLGTPDGIKRAMQAVGRPVLTLVDEVLNYVRKATADESQQDRAQQDMAFLRDLMEATNTSDHAALVIVMIASDVDTVAMGTFGEAIRAELEGMLERYGRSIATTSGGDFAEIIRRRLFEKAPPTEVLDATIKSFRDHVGGAWAGQFAAHTWWTDGFDANVRRGYPFHPALVELVEREWANRAGFQRVRSTIQIFAAAVHLWTERAKAGEWAPPLIGLGDLPLSDTKVRQSILDSGVIPDQKNTTNYREIAANDVVDTDDQRGAARRIDLDRTSGMLLQTNPRVAERMATAMWLLSLAPRSQGVQGATEPELRVAGYVPDSTCELAEVDATLTTLESVDKGISTLHVDAGSGSNKPRRLRMSTTQTLQMFFKTQRGSVEAPAVRKVLREVTQAEMAGGPFDRFIFVSAERHVAEPGVTKGDELTQGLLAAIVSEVPDVAETRLVVLDPTAFTLLNGVDSETRVAVSAALGLDAPGGWNLDLAWPTPLSSAYASSCVFVLVNTQRRSAAVAAATDYIAWQRVTEIANVAADDDLMAKAKAQVAEKRDAVRGYLRKAFQHIVYLGENRTAATAKLEQDAQTALDGTVVWATLDEREKVFGQGQFDKTALLFQMEDRYWGKALSHLRADFYRSHRLPLLHGGDTDLKNALFAAARSTPPALVIKDAGGDVVEPGSPADIAIGSDKFQLDRYKKGASEGSGNGLVGVDTAGGGEGRAGGGEQVKTGDGTGIGGGTGVETVDPPHAQPSAEKRVVVSLTGSAFDTEVQRMGANQLFQHLTDLIDRGDISYGKFQMELIVKSDQAAAVTDAAEQLGASASAQDM
jgi:hypothetical protein